MTLLKTTFVFFAAVIFGMNCFNNNKAQFPSEIESYSMIVGSTNIDTLELKVIRVSGDVFLYNKNGKQKKLTRRATITTTSRLQFSHSEDFIIVLNHDKKLFVIRPTNNKILGGYEYSPLSKTTARKGMILTYLDFNTYLENLNLLVLGEKIEFEVGGKEFPLDSNHFFYINYQLLLDSTDIAKRLPFNGQKFFITKDSLFQLDGGSIPIDSTTNFSLHYYNAEKPSSRRINSFNLIFPDEKEVKIDVEIILEYLGRFTDRKEKIAAVFQILKEVYGTPDGDNLERWLKDEFEI